MATSQNGWPIVGKSSCDQGLFAGVHFPNGILKGDVATIARWHLAQYEARVEKLVPGTCWGWLVKNIKGSATKSNHGSGTAWDCNANEHPQGVAPSRNMSAAQIRACHAIEADSGGVLRWGGDFSNPDPMHWEIVASRADVAKFAGQIRDQQEDEMASVQDALNAVNGDIVKDGSGIHENLVELVAEEAPSAVLGDIIRGPGDPKGQSGLNTFLQKTIDQHVSAALAPVLARLKELEGGGS